MISFKLLVGVLFLSTLSFASGTKSASCQKALVRDYSEAQEVPVHRIESPKTIEELRKLVLDTKRPIAVKGTGFSMGGQTGTKHGVVVDMKNLNRVLAFDARAMTIRVQAGITWRDIQKNIDPHGLAVKIMQSYNNFSVGGSLSVNAHGRYSGYGPIITSVLEVTVMKADGSILTCSRTENPELFAAVIGGYGAFGIILEAKLQLTNNHKLERRTASFINGNIEIAVRQFLVHFDQTILNNPEMVMANADIYPPAYNTVTCITFQKTDRDPTITAHMQPPAPRSWRALWHAGLHSLEQFFSGIKWWRGRVVAPEELVEDRVVYQNWEASYDNAELMPLNDRIPWLKYIFPFSNRKSLLQEYFIPKSKLPEFIAKMAKVFTENNVNVSNISLRHVPQNMESMLSWSKEESFAVVVYYTQPYGRNREAKLAEAREWTRKLIAEAEAVGGSFYLPYQIYATRDQFHKAYPRANEFFALKTKHDPEGRFNNSLWEQYHLSDDTYYYQKLMATPEGRDALTAYFTNVFSINKAANFIKAIEVAMENTTKNQRDLNDRNIYDELLKVLPGYANSASAKFKSTLKALRVQQKEMADQTVEALKELGVNQVNGYVEIGTPGRYVLPLRARMKILGHIYAVNETFGLADMVETSWGLRIPAVATSKRILLSNYDMFLQAEIPNKSVDLVSMFIGLHHCPVEKLAAFVSSIARILRVGGKFVLRDHDADERIFAMAFIAHSTYNAGLGLPYGAELEEIRNLHPLNYWKELLAKAGLKFVGTEKHQKGDPTGNTLMVFEKVEETPEVQRAILDSFRNSEAPASELDTLPGYHRPQANTYMTQAEWFLVDIFEELSRFVRKAPWYDFPWDDFIKLYDEVYQKHKAFAELEGIIDDKAYAEYDQMDRFLLNGIKGLFKAMKWMANRTAKTVDTPEAREYMIEAQWFMEDFFKDYARFMSHSPWYLLAYKEYLPKIDEYLAEHGTFAPGYPASVAKRVDRALVKQSKRLLRGMQLAAWAIQKFMGEQVADPYTQFLIEANDVEVQALELDEKDELIALGNDLHLMKTERYMPFTRAMLAVSKAKARVVNVAGNKHISVIMASPQAQLPSFTVSYNSIMTYQYPTRSVSHGSQHYFHTVRVNVKDLPTFLVEAQNSGQTIIRVHDF